MPHNTHAVWLDALDEMPQLQTLTLHSASPIALPLPFVVERTVTLPSLTHLDMSASVDDCALALAHLDLPALTWLCLIQLYQKNSSVQRAFNMSRDTPMDPRTFSRCRVFSSALIIQPA